MLVEIHRIRHCNLFVSWWKFTASDTVICLYLGGNSQNQTSSLSPFTHQTSLLQHTLKPPPASSVCLEAETLYLCCIQFHEWLTILCLHRLSVTWACARERWTCCMPCVTAAMQRRLWERCWSTWRQLITPSGKKWWVASGGVKCRRRSVDDVNKI